MNKLSPQLHHAIAITIALAMNNLDEAKQLILNAKADDIGYQYLYEAILQMYLFAGFPATLEGLALLKSCYPDEPIIDKEEYNIALYSARGLQTCKRIYDTVFDKMMHRVQSFSPDLADWMIIEGYGKTLSRTGMPLKDRELINVCIIAIGKWSNQLYSHIRGALLVGAQYQEIEQALQELSRQDLHSSHEHALYILEGLKK